MAPLTPALLLTALVSFTYGVTASPAPAERNFAHIAFDRNPALQRRAFSGPGGLYDKDFLDADSARVAAKYGKAAENYQNNVKLNPRSNFLDNVPSLPPVDVAKLKRSKGKRAPQATGVDPLTVYFSGGTGTSIHFPLLRSTYFDRLYLDSMYYGPISIVLHLSLSQPVALTNKLMIGHPGSNLSNRFRYRFRRPLGPRSKFRFHPY